MIAQASPLVIHNFFVLQSKLRYVASPDEINRTAVMHYPVDVDFTLKKVEGGINLFTKVGYNDGKEPLAGYSFFVEAVGVFSLQDEESLPEKTVHNLQYTSTLSLIINFLRGYLMDATSYLPLGPYILPAIDLNNLIKSKRGKTPSGTPTKGIDENSGH